MPQKLLMAAFLQRQRTRTTTQRQTSSAACGHRRWPSGPHLAAAPQLPQLPAGEHCPTHSPRAATEAWAVTSSRQRWPHALTAWRRRTLPSRVGTAVPSSDLVSQPQRSVTCGMAAASKRVVAPRLVSVGPRHMHAPGINTIAASCICFPACISKCISPTLVDNPRYGTFQQSCFV